MRGGLIEVYKITRATDKMNSHHIYLRIRESKTRGHRFKV